MYSMAIPALSTATLHSQGGQSKPGPTFSKVLGKILGKKANSENILGNRPILGKCRKNLGKR